MDSTTSLSALLIFPERKYHWPDAGAWDLLTTNVPTSDACRIFSLVRGREASLPTRQVPRQKDAPASPPERSRPQGTSTKESGQPFCNCPADPTAALGTRFQISLRTA